MCGGPVGDIVDLGGDIVSGVGDVVEGGLNAVGDAVEWVGDTATNVVEGVASGDPKAIALVAAAVLTAQPELLAEMGLGEAAAASEFIAADAANLAAQGLTQEQIAATLGQSYGLDAAAASQIAGATSAGSYGEAAAEYGSAAEPGFETQIFDDGSQLITDSTTGQVIGGTDTAGSTFTTEGGLGTYTDTGAPLGGTPETTFGGGLASQPDVQALLDYNAAQATSGLSSSDLQNARRAYNLANQLLGGGSTAVGALSAFPNLTGGSGTAQTATIPNLTPGLTKADTSFELTGEPTVAHAAAGGYMDYTSGYNQTDTDAQKLKPTLTKASSEFTLTGLPVKKADGGVIEHNPEFFSEGGLSMAHRFVKGEGDGTSDSVPAMLATGEFVIPADVVSSLGNGDNDSGAEVLDEFLSVIRKHKRAADSRELPPDSKGALEYLQDAYHKVA